MTFQFNSFSTWSRCLLVTFASLILTACSQQIKFNNVDITGSKAFGKEFSADFDRHSGGAFSSAFDNNFDLAH